MPPQGFSPLLPLPLHSSTLLSSSPAPLHPPAPLSPELLPQEHTWTAPHTAPLEIVSLQSCTSAPPLPHLPPQVQDSCGRHPSCFIPYCCHPHSYQGKQPFSISDAPRWLHENVGSLHEFILAVHSGLRVQVRNSHPFISFSPLWLYKDFLKFHGKVLEYRYLHCAVVLCNNVLPKWFVGSLVCHVIDIVFSALVEISPRLTSIWAVNVFF